MFTSTRKLLAYERGVSWSWRVFYRDHHPVGRSSSIIVASSSSCRSHSSGCWENFNWDWRLKTCSNRMPSCILGTKINGTIPISPLPPAQSVFVASTFRLFSADASTTTTTTTTTATDTTVSTTTATTTLDDIPVQKEQSIDIVDSIAGDDNDDDYDAQGFDSLLDQLGAANDHPPVEDVTPEKLEKMAERLRFFLSDANLRKDAFFRNFMFQKNPTIPVVAILRCNSVKIITQSPEVVVRAAQDLCSDFLFVADAMPDAAGRHSLMAAGIGRLEPFTADKMEENIPLTVYLGNLPYDDRYYATQQDIRDLFPGKEISVINFRFRRPSLKDEYKGKNKKIPVGCCLVEFKNLADAEKVAEEYLTMKENGEPLTPNKTLNLGDSELEVMRLKDYTEFRQKQKEDGVYPFRPNTY